MRVWKRVLTRNAVDAYGVEEGIDVHTMERVLMFMLQVHAGVEEGVDT
jgi:hypothetical protein